MASGIVFLRRGAEFDFRTQRQLQSAAVFDMITTAVTAEETVATSACYLRNGTGADALPDG